MWKIKKALRSILRCDLSWWINRLVDKDSLCLMRTMHYLRNQYELIDQLLGELYSQLNEESLKAYISHHREDTKWIPVMLTNFMIHLYFLGVAMGRGQLLWYIKNNRGIAGLDKDRHNSTPNDDKLYGLRCLAFHLNLKDVWDRYKDLETRTQ